MFFITIRNRTVYQLTKKTYMLKIKRKYTVFEHCFNDYKNGVISLRSFISHIKEKQHFIDEVLKRTQFLDCYANITMNERIYYVINELTTIVKCKYCGEKASFISTKDGYRDICSKKECHSKQLSDVHRGLTKISQNRYAAFFKWEQSITSPEQLNDNVIQKKIRYKKYVYVITNTIILDYIDNRYSDSYSRVESWHRIVKTHLEEKPKCANPNCNNYVKYVGKKSELYTKYCCESCSANSEETKQKCKDTQLKNWGHECCYKSEKYQAKLMAETGYAFITQIPSVKEKAIQTKLERYGVPYATQNEEVKKKLSKTLKSVYRPPRSTSMEEEAVAKRLTELGFAYFRQFKSKMYPFYADFLIVNYDRLIVIEYQGGLFHHTHPYTGSEEDLVEIERLKERHEKVMKERPDLLTTIENQKIYIWSKSDVKKRKLAKKNGVLLLEIFPYKTVDVLDNLIAGFIEKHKLVRDDNKVNEFIDNISDFRYDFKKNENKLNTGYYVNPSLIYVSADTLNPTLYRNMLDASAYIDSSILREMSEDGYEEIVKNYIEDNNLNELYGDGFITVKEDTVEMIDTSVAEIKIE